jgi:hypothetical protein
MSDQLEHSRHERSGRHRRSERCGRSERDECRARTGGSGTNGADGEDGEDFAGTFTSPNGQFSLSVTDAGVVASGPNGSQLTIGTGFLTASGFGAQLALGAGSASLSGTTMGSLSAAGSSVMLSGFAATINGAQVRLNGACRPVAHVGSLTNGAAEFVPQQITTGSSTVFVGC